jgi:N-acetylglucosamine transport system substrate-binding protein
LARNGFLWTADEPISHTEAQTRWLRGQAAFLPCGSWLENEMKAVTPDGFDMVVSPTPSLTAADVLPRTALLAIPAEPFFVPAKANNPKGGLELLRTMLSGQVSRDFAVRTGAFNRVAGAAADVQGGGGFASARAALNAAGEHTLFFHFFIRYLEMYLAMGFATRELLAARSTPEQWSEQCQALADAAAAADSLAKPTR